MNISWLESMIYGFVSGLSEFLPVSSGAHQDIMLYLFGVDAPDPVRNFFVHIALLLCVFTCSRTLLDMIKRERGYASKSRYSYQYRSQASQYAGFARSTALPMILFMLLIRFILKPNSSLIFTALFLILNGFVIFIPDRMMKGNKDAGLMTPLDSIFVGAVGGLSVLSGFSRFGCTYSVSVARGAARNHAFSWSLLLSIPALVCICFIDVVSMFTGPTTAFWSNFLSYLISGITAYAGAYLSISAVRSLTERKGLSAFAYYCWGTALLSFFIFLTVA